MPALNPIFFPWLCLFSQDFLHAPLQARVNIPKKLNTQEEEQFLGCREPAAVSDPCPSRTDIYALHVFCFAMFSLPGSGKKEDGVPKEDAEPLKARSRCATARRTETAAGVMEALARYFKCRVRHFLFYFFSTAQKQKEGLKNAASLCGKTTAGNTQTFLRCKVPQVAISASAAASLWVSGC